ncbi:FBP domain-containing protein [Dethiothermospora halolimnae]|uniref:FBP domain-containing protein n=1 Tax=Dethiothermospora halolimnae TaxID=3114390 RepID=UPI003CCC0C4B
MKAFIKKHEYNYIRNRLNDLKNAYKSCVDINIIEATKAYIKEEIFNIFTNLSKEEKGLLDIREIDDHLHIDIQINKYLDQLNKYVYGMPNITTGQIKRLFKKEKKLKLPSQDILSEKKVYLGWVDKSTRKLFVAYNMNGNLLGMKCRIINHASSNSRRCVLCNHIDEGNEVAFVSPICKTDNGNYRSIGFDICLDSKICNERIASTEKLEKILKDVNNIKL